MTDSIRRTDLRRTYLPGGSTIKQDLQTLYLISETNSDLVAKVIDLISAVEDLVKNGPVVKDTHEIATNLSTVQTTTQNIITQISKMEGLIQGAARNPSKDGTSSQNNQTQTPCPTFGTYVDFNDLKATINGLKTTISQELPSSGNILGRLADHSNFVADQVNKTLKRLDEVTASIDKLAATIADTDDSATLISDIRTEVTQNSKDLQSISTALAGVRGVLGDLSNKQFTSLVEAVLREYGYTQKGDRPDSGERAMRYILLKLRDLVIQAVLIGVVTWWARNWLSTQANTINNKYETIVNDMKKEIVRLQNMEAARQKESSRRPNSK